jgi:hypothetical protein
LQSLKQKDRPFDTRGFLGVIQNDPVKLSNMFNRVWGVAPLAVAGAAAATEKKDGGQQGGQRMPAQMLPSVDIVSDNSGTQYPYYYKLTDEEKRFFSSNTPIGRAVRAKAQQGKVGQTYNDLSRAAKTIEQTAAKSVGAYGQDSSLENIVEVFDPSGISSWDDVYSSYEQSGMSPETYLEIFGALPLLGKVGKAGKFLQKSLSAATPMVKGTSRLARNERKAIAAGKLAAGVLQATPYAGRATDVVQAIDQAPDVPVLPFGKGGQHGGLDRWFAEKWVDIKTGKECGRQEGEKRAGYPACRPSKRVSEETPKTTSELSSAEKEKFKRSKTSSERISYQHRRKEFGGEWLEKYDDDSLLPKAQLGKHIPNWLNPYNWGVPDYSDKKDFSFAYYSAKKSGEKEFMWNGKRYSTNYAGTPRQEVGRYGINGRSVNSKDINNPAQVNLYPVLGQYKPGHISASIGNNETSINYGPEGNNPFGISNVKNKGEKSFNVYGQDNLTFSNKAVSLPLGEYSYSLGYEYAPSDWNLFTNNCADNVCDAFGIPRTKGIETPSRALSKIKEKYPTLDVTSRTYEDYYDLYEKLQDQPNKEILSQAKNILGIASSPEIQNSPLAKSLIGTVQGALAEEGYNLPNSLTQKGNYDGILGEETKRALKDWQKKKLGGEWLDKYKNTKENRQKIDQLLGPPATGNVDYVPVVESLAGGFSAGLAKSAIAPVVKSNLQSLQKYMEMQDSPFIKIDLPMLNEAGKKINNWLKNYTD